MPEGNHKEKLYHDLVALNGPEQITAITDIKAKQNMLSVNVLPAPVPMKDQNHRNI